jgi:exodeoxyribonuclease V alpha subunit
MTVDVHDPRIAVGATGLLAEFNRAEVIDAADVHVARRLTALAHEPDEGVALAVALAVRAVRGGSVCVDLATVAAEVVSTGSTDGGGGLPWPEPAAWLAAVAASPLSGTPPVLRLLGDSLLYLDRYWREEEQVCADLLARTVTTAPDPAALTAGLERVFTRPGYDEQRAAATIALSQRTTVLTGGPGTGKTTTVAALLALLTGQAEVEGRPRLRIALAAPTGKASARLQQAVQSEVADLPPEDQQRLAGLQAVTLHRLLGVRPDTSARFRHDRDNRLPHDLIVVDETSMVSLTMMARLLEAVRPESRLILVGDPDQLASIEAGAVLADLVDGLAARDDVRIAALTTSHRYGESIRSLAEAVRAGEADRVVELLHDGGEHVEYLADASLLRERLVGHALGLRSAALAGDTDRALAALDTQRLLCAHREGPHGVRHWNRQVERWLSEETGEGIWSPWYAGRPVLVTANDYGLGLYNGDTGVVTRRADGALRASIASTGATPLDFATSRLGEVETMHAMTIHKSQGSQAREVVVLLPPRDSRLLTRELFYTAITRATHKVVVVGSDDEVRAAIERRAQRATGLAQRLRNRTTE